MGSRAVILFVAAAFAAAFAAVACGSGCAADPSGTNCTASGPCEDASLTPADGAGAGVNQPVGEPCNPSLGRLACDVTSCGCDPVTDRCVATNCADAGGAPCATDVDCPDGFGCGYPLDGGCEAKGVCVAFSGGACSAEYFCSCSGQLTTGCQFGPFGPPYVGLPVPVGAVPGERCAADASTEGGTCLGSSGDLGICFPDGNASSPICVTSAFCAKLSNFTGGVAASIERCEAADDTPCSGAGACATSALAQACLDSSSTATCAPIVAACADAGTVGTDASVPDGGGGPLSEPTCEQYASGLSLSGRSEFATCMSASCNLATCVAALL